MLRRRRQPGVQLTLVEEIKAPKANCRRCGRVIRSKTALFIGMGPRCAKLSGKRKGPMRQIDILEGADGE